MRAEIVKTAETTRYTVIWLHGLGADGHDFVPLIPELKLPASLPVKFVFPHAPVRPITINNGYEMRAWYDLLSLERGKTANKADVLKTISQITDLIAAEIASGTAAERILLAGFSQGGVIALQCGLRFPQRLAGIMALSTYLPFDQDLLEKEMQSAQQGLSIFAAHGEQDSVIPFTSWQDYVPKLKAKGFDVEAHQYAMEHSLCAEEIADMSLWMVTKALIS